MKSRIKGRELLSPPAVETAGLADTVEFIRTQEGAVPAFKLPSRTELGK